MNKGAKRYCMANRAKKVNRAGKTVPWFHKIKYEEDSKIMYEGKEIIDYPDLIKQVNFPRAIPKFRFADETKQDEFE